jgi:hypothetical protein
MTMETFLSPARSISALRPRESTAAIRAMRERFTAHLYSTYRSLGAFNPPSASPTCPSVTAAWSWT